MQRSMQRRMQRSMKKRMQKRMKMRGGGEITQDVLDALNAAGKTATDLQTQINTIAKPDESSASVGVGGTKKRKLKTRRRKTMKR